MLTDTRAGAVGALLAVVVVAACSRARPAERAPGPSQAPRPVPFAVPLRPIVQEPISSIPTHFDPAGHLVARCEGASCDVWERGNDRYRGQVPAARCAGWVTPEPAAAPPPGQESQPFVQRDPVTGGAWTATDIAGGECDEETLSGPDGEHWTGGSKDPCRSPPTVTVLGSSAGRDAFVVSKREETWTDVSVSLSVVRLRPRFDSWSAWGQSYPKEGPAPEPALHVALSRDGSWLVVVSEPVGGAPRAIALSREGEKHWSALDATGVSRLLDPAAVETVGLSADERTVLLGAKAVTAALPLDGKTPARRLSGKEAEQLLSEARAGDAADGFSTTDGEIFTRSSDSVSMRADGCWLPAEWWDEAGLARIRVLAGDAIDGHLLDRAKAESLFCSPARFEAFVRGEPMPPRPEARLLEER